MKKNKHIIADVFTLIELIIVVSIIAILASILLPALSKSKKKTKRLGCINNLKQMGVAMTMYTGDYNGYLPKNHSVAGQCWDWQIADYLNYKKTSSIFHCPNGKVYKTNVPNKSRGYVMNEYIGNNSYGINGRIGKIPRASEQGLLFDLWVKAYGESNGFGGEGYPEHFYGGGVAYEYATVVDALTYLAWRHSRGMNFLKTDGSADWTLPGSSNCGEKPIWLFVNTGANAGKYWRDGSYH